MTDAPPPEAAPPPEPVAPPPTAPQRSLPLPLPAILIIAAILVIGVIAFFATHSQTGSPSQSAYTVQPYTPPSELITASDRVIAHATPDAASPAVVMFGQGVTLAVNGRVSRGLGSDWYAIAWNGHPAFVRQQDAVEGHGAPPVAAEHQPQTEADIRKPEEDDVKPDEDQEAVTPDEPDSSLGMDLSDVDWIRPPNARDFARFYPHRALDQGRSGRVVLDCVAQPNGMLDCSVASENPPGYGFGQAAVGISRQVRIQPTMPDGRSVAGGHLRLPLTFRAD